MSLTRINYTKSWENPADFPTVETSEAKVRADLQELPNQIRDQVNALISELENLGMEEYMTQADFNKMMDAYLAQLRTKPVSGWAAQTWADAKKSGIADGTAPQGLITRQEVVTMIDRAISNRQGVK